MVWDSGQTALYGAVERHNSTDGGGAGSAAVGGIGIEERDTPPREAHCAPCGRACDNRGISALFGGSDTLIIAALIFVLAQEQADRRLIFALLLVLVL